MISCFHEKINFRLLSHESNQHSIEHSPCKHCPRKGFTSKKDLIMHETHEHNTKIYSCSVCGVRVESVWAARSHFRESHSEKPLYCHLCHNSFSSMIQVIFNFTKKIIIIFFCEKQNFFFREMNLYTQKLNLFTF